MNKETYEAFQRVIKYVRVDVVEKRRGVLLNLKDLEELESWADEVAKEYDEE